MSTQKEMAGDRSNKTRGSRSQLMSAECNELFIAEPLHLECVCLYVQLHSVFVMCGLSVEWRDISDAIDRAHSLHQLNIRGHKAVRARD